MEKLPSTIVIHKRVNTLDSRLAQMKGQLANNPLEKNLGFFDFGKYTLAPNDTAFTFIKINNIWNNPIQAVMNSEEEISEEETEVLNYGFRPLRLIIRFLLSYDERAVIGK
jgi:hypothetical protein